MAFSESFCTPSESVTLNTICGLAGRSAKAVRGGVLQVQVERVGLHEGASESQHIAAIKGVTAGVLEHLSRFQFVQVSAVLRLPCACQVHRHVGSNSGWGVSCRENAMFVSYPKCRKPMCRKCAEPTLRLLRRHSLPVSA